MDEKNRFIKGTIILACANFIAKILGAFFKIPLTYILREEGMAIFNTASSVYSMFLTFVISGIPLASSRIISADTALGKPADAIKTVTVSKRLLLIISFFAWAILFFGANPLAIAMKDPEAGLAIKIISPSIVFVALGTAYKSYFQGTGCLVPTAISQVVEAFIRLLVGFVLALLFAKSSVGIAAAAASLGLTVGEIIATLILGGVYLFYRLRTKGKSSKRFKDICSSIMAVAIPMFICSVTLSALNMVDVATVRNQLLRINFTQQSANSFLLRYSSYTSIFDNLLQELKLSAQGARWLYGSYSGYALTVFHLPMGMIATMCVSILPLVAGNLAKNNLGAMRSACNTAINITLFLAVPASVLFFTSSNIILKILFHNTASAHMLSLVSPCLIFLCMSQLFNSIFHAAGRIYEPFIIQLLGIGLKLLGNIILIKIPILNIDGAIISSLVAYAFIMVLDGFMLYKMYGVSYSIKELLTPVLGAIPMYLVLRLTYTPILYIFSNNIIAFLINTIIGIFAYFLAVSLFSSSGIEFVKILRKNNNSKKTTLKH